MFSHLASHPHQSRTRATQLWILFALWAVLYLLSSYAPPVLDDADATHAQAAEAMLRTGDLVTLHVDGIRYLEKPPLPYWITALALRCFGINSFAVHLPLALAVLGLAALGFVWGNRLQPDADAPGAGLFTTGFRAALLLLTAAGTFLFTRVFIPDALLSLLLGFVLYASLRALESPASHRRWAFSAWIALALAVLTKGLVALVFAWGALLLYLPLAGQSRLWRRLHPGVGSLLFLAVAAPWHILAGLRNRGGASGHGFFWFYFINEHVLRFLGRRYPPDYNKLPAALYWSLHLVWLFPWSFFAPATGLFLWHRRRELLALRRSGTGTFAHCSLLLLSLFSALVLLFFSLSTNQEYYTFPVYLPLLLLTAVALGRTPATNASGAAIAPLQRWVRRGYGMLTVLGVLAALALAWGLWLSRHLPSAPDVGDLLVPRDVAGYTLSMAHLFDLTTAAFSALRLPAALACAALLLGPATSLGLDRRGRPDAALATLAGTSAMFLVAAHLALVRFGPMLSSKAFAEQILTLERTGAAAPGSEVLLFGDQAFGSSIPFYLDRQVLLVEGRSTSMIFGSTFPDAPPIFRTAAQLKAGWGHGPRKLLFVPQEQRAAVHQLLGTDVVLLYQHSGKVLLTDRPLAPAPGYPRLTR